MKSILYCFGKHRSLDQSLEWVEALVAVIQEAFPSQAGNVSRTLRSESCWTLKMKPFPMSDFLYPIPSGPTLSLLLASNSPYW